VGLRLLDTSLAIWILRGRPDIEDLAVGTPFFLPWVTMAELFTGAFVSTVASRDIAAVRSFCQNADVLYPDAGTCEHYGDLAARLRKKGKPLPTNDIWIAALALQHDMILATCDPHFQHVPGLKTENWLA